MLGRKCDEGFTFGIFSLLLLFSSGANLCVGGKGEEGEDRQEENRRMSKEGSQDSFVPAGSQAGEEAGKEHSGQSNDSGYCYPIAGAI